jgi:xanthosine utilization system XapX-like protein
VVLLLLVTQALALGVGGAAGLLLAPSWLRAPALPVVALIGAGMLVYLAIVRLRPPWLTRWPLLAPLFAAGVRGHLESIAARLPHVAALVLLQWGAFRIWGIAVPLLVALGLIPLVLLVAALPITPGGLGTVQAVQAALFARYALGTTLQVRQAAVVALSLAHGALAMVVQILIGVVCMRLLGGLRPGEIGATSAAEESTGDG